MKSLHTCQSDADLALCSVTRAVSGSVDDICVAKLKSSELMSLGDGEWLPGVVMEQRFIPLNINILSCSDEVRRRLTEVNHRSLGV